jgi:hypothetical protein
MHFNTCSLNYRGVDSVKLIISLNKNEMENFKKLSRDEMKKVLGGVTEPACTNACGGSAGTCPNGQTCSSSACPGDASNFHNVCS